jgi:hypothetical protein
MKSELDATAGEGALAPSLSVNKNVGAVVNLVAAYAAVFAVFWYIQSATAGIVDPDGYYHIRWSWLLRQTLSEGKLPSFVWLPLTILNEQAYVDHHFLFHLFQIPFTFTSDLAAGAKFSAVVYGALAVFSCFAFLIWARVSYPWAWLLVLLACSGPFLFRMSLPRAPSVTVVTLVLGLWLLWTRRTVWLGALAFLLVWMYSLFPLVSVLACAWAVGVWLEERRVEWKLVAATLVGIGLGLVINPYFPRNIALFANHVGMKVASEYEISVGNEWYPYESWYLLVSCAVAWVAQVVGWLTTRFERREGLARETCLLLFSSFLLVLTMKSRRFVEYWPAFAVLYAAFALEPYFRRYTWEAIAEGWPRRLTVAALCLLIAVLSGVLVSNIVGTRQSVAGESDPNIFQGAARWLTDNTPEGARVFNTDWDRFPMLFFHNTHNVYTSGLDPTYLLYADPELSGIYVDITLGRTPDPAHLIRDRFGARYAFTTASGHEDFIRNATTDDHMKIVYEDEHAVVLELNE